MSKGNLSPWYVCMAMAQSLVSCQPPATSHNPSVCGLLQVYVHYSELLNFFKALSSLLALPADAGPAAAMAAVSNIIQQAARWGDKHKALLTLVHSGKSPMIWQFVCVILATNKTS